MEPNCNATSRLCHSRLISTALLAALLAGTIIGSLLQSGARAATPAPVLYDRLIHADPELSESFHDKRISDLVSALQSITGQIFKLSPNPGFTARGLYLFKSSSPILSRAPARVRKQLDRLRTAKRGSHIIYSDGKKQLWIVGRTEIAIQHGLYHYLERLGMRWYFPSDHWIITPSLAGIGLRLDEFREPDFVGTDFEGTGGLDILPHGVQPSVSNPVRKRWNDWTARTQWPKKRDNRLGGHTFEQFNDADMQINGGGISGATDVLLRQDPLNMPEVGGIRKRLPDRPCANKCVQKLAYSYHGPVSCAKPNAVVSYISTPDSSPQSNDAQIVGALSTPASLLGAGKVYEFDARRSVIVTKSDSPLRRNPRVVAAWINPRPLASDDAPQFLFGYHGSDYLDRNQALQELAAYYNPATGKVVVKQAASGTRTRLESLAPVASGPGQWTHILVRRWNQGGELELYVNGTPQGAVSHNRAVDIKANEFRIFDFWVGNNSRRDAGFRGRIDDVRIYRGANWTQADITTLLSQGGASHRAADKELQLDFDSEERLCEAAKDYSSYGGAIRLYSEWSKRRYLELRGNNDRYRIHSIEPSDGGGHDTSGKSVDLLRHGPYRSDMSPAQSRADSTVSDRIFHFANEVTRHLRSAFPEISTSLLAYNWHAKVPSIPIDPNIHISLTPHENHFRHSGQTAAQLMDAWIQKSAANPWGPLELSIYDYWANSDARRDLPGFALQTVPHRLRPWSDKGFQAFHLESAFSIGAVGLHLYLVSRLAWDVDMGEQALDATVEEFYELAFGPARPAMERMLDRWYRGGFLLNRHELAISYDDLLAADQLAAGSGDPDLRKRLDDFKAYLHYLRLYLERYDPTSSQPVSQRIDDLVAHQWRIYDTLMINSGYMSRVEFPGRDDWSEFPATPYARAELDGLMSDGANSYDPIPGLEAARRSFSNNLVPRTPVLAARTQPYVGPRVYARQQRYAFYLQNSSKAALNWGLEPAQAAPPVRLAVRLLDGDQREIGSRFLSGTGGAITIFKNLTPGLHFIETTLFNSGHRARVLLSPSSDMHLVQTGRFFATYAPETFVGPPPVGVPAFFYVPPDVATVFFFMTAPTGTTVAVAPSTMEVPPQQLDRFIYSFDTNGETDVIWEMKNFAGPLRFFNLPNVFSFSRDHMLIPEELATP